MRTKAKPAGASGGQRFLATDWKPFEVDTLCGSFSIVTPDGLKINGLMLHEYDGRRWICWPPTNHTKNGSMGYVQIVQFETQKSWLRFHKAALRALDKLRKREPKWP